MREASSAYIKGVPPPWTVALTSGAVARLLENRCPGTAWSYLDHPRPGRWSVGPNASRRTWLAATPAMIIMHPMATYCITIAVRPLPQFFAIDCAWVPRS